MDLEKLRAETPGCAHRNHLNNAGAGLLSNRTVSAMTDYLRLEAEIGGYEAFAASTQVVDGVYDGLARLVGGRRAEIALFDNSTHAWNAAFYSLPLGPGDRILTARSEYASSVLAYWQVAQRTGAEVVVVPDDADGQIDLRALADLIDERVKVIGLTWVPTSGGLVNPAAAVGELARAADVLYLLDATQVAGQLPIDVTELGCDLLTSTGRKFLRGPRGTGFLWAGERALQRLEPFVAEVGSAAWDAQPGSTSFAWADGARRFETWEYSYSNVVGLGAAVDQALEIGLDVIAQRCRDLGERLRDGLTAIDGVHCHDLGPDRCAIVTASVDGYSSDEVAAELARHDVNVSQTQGDHNQYDLRGVHPLVRISPHYYNTEDEVDRAVEVIAKLATA